MRTNRIVSFASLLFFTLAPPNAFADPEHIQVYGFIIPTWTLASGAVASFSQPNSSAYPAAGNPAVDISRDAGRSTFQVAQSRIGIHITPTTKARGDLEFDFIDFSKASPTT